MFEKVNILDFFKHMVKILETDDEIELDYSVYKHHGKEIVNVDFFHETGVSTITINDEMEYEFIRGHDNDENT